MGTEIILPKFGLVFWTWVVFLTIFFLLKKYAWGPILGALKERDEKIASDLRKAAEAELKLKETFAENQKLLQQASIERDRILKDAQEMKEKIIAEANKKAAEEASIKLKQATDEAEMYKSRARTEMKDEVSNLSFLIAEKILQRELKNKKTHESFIESLITELQLSPNQRATR